MSLTARVAKRREIDVAECVDRLATEGYAIIGDWLDRATADKLRTAIDDYIDGDAGNVQRNTDDRIIGFEHLDPAAEDYRGDAFLEQIATAYMGSEQKVLFTMANRLKVILGQVARSGGFWHRDRKARQFKALTYLSDVKIENGAFCIVPRSATRELFEDDIEQTGFAFDGQRWEDGDIAPFLARIKDRILPIEAEAGTCVLFDGSLIHGGLPISSGVRYAMTNYYYGQSEINLKKMQAKMVPAVKPLEMPAFSTV